MPNSKLSDPIAVKLLEADADLAQQEVQITAQLEAVRTKRKSLEVVLHMFDPSTDEASPAPISPAVLKEVLAETIEPESQIPTEEPARQVGRRRETATTTTSKPKTTKAKAPKATKPAKEPKAKVTKPSGRGKRSEQSTPAPTPAKSPAPTSNNWQDYVRQEFRHQSLPQAVLTVLQQKSDGVVEVTSIMDTIFMDSIPKEARLNARDRLSNVLSVGLKNNKWYRGKTGLYSLSKTAADETLSS